MGLRAFFDKTFINETPIFLSDFLFHRNVYTYLSDCECFVNFAWYDVN